MAGMKISLDSAMRARDVSQPGPADDAVAEQREAAIAASKREPGTRPATSSHAAASAAGLERTRADQSPGDAAQRRAAIGRGRGRRRPTDADPH
jgi:hypothetical protein